MSVKRVAVLATAVLVLAAGAPAWHRHGHDLTCRAVVELTAGRLPEFFNAGVETLAHVSQDPDAFTHPIAPDQLHQAEAPEHYFDFEMLEGAPIPLTRYAFIRFCAAKGLEPTRVGLLPYAITEWTQRLTVAFAEYRRWPDNPAVQSKCLVYAGLLAHYAADGCQPLHTTIHWDGRALANRQSPRTGIHNRVDALPAKLATPPAELVAGMRAEPYGDLFGAILAELDRSHQLVDHVYALESQLPPMESVQPLTAEVDEFCRERMQAASVFIASLYLTAWENSATIAIPDWHHSFPERQAATTQPAVPPVLRATGRALLHPATAPAKDD